MLELNNLTIKLNGYLVLENVSLQVKPGRLVSVIGPNGSGKTSLISAIAGIIKPAKGNIKNTFKKTVIIPQKVTYPEEITLFDYISSVFYKSGWKWFLTAQEKELICDTLNKVNLYSKRDLYLNQLSGGELQLADIGLCLLTGADLILLDEPTSELDPANKVKIFKILKTLTRDDITVICVSHDINLAGKFSDEFIAVSKEKNVFWGSRSEILDHKLLSEIFGLNDELIQAFV